MWYRLYFLDGNDHIAARDEFKADNDHTAIAVAEVLHDACSDRSPGFELWEGARRLARNSCEGLVQPRQEVELTLAMQEMVLEREEIMRQSQWCIAVSRRLLERIDQFNTKISAGRGGSAQPR